jgi:hypothetical protein
MRNTINCAVAFAIVQIPVAAAHIAPEALTCADLSGTYFYYGKWQKFESSIQDSTGARPSWGPGGAPRLDERALGIRAQEVIQPQWVTISIPAHDGNFIVNVVGKGVDSRWRRSHPLVPTTLTFSCKGGKWLREVVTPVNDGNLLSNSELRKAYLVFLDGEGNLVVEGQETFTTGLIFKKVTSEIWIASFPKMETPASKPQ